MSLSRRAGETTVFSQRSNYHHNLQVEYHRKMVLSVEIPSISALQGFSTEGGIITVHNGTERMNLPLLQSRMKCDPEGYESELLHLFRHFEACLAVFQQHAALKSASLGETDPSAAKELGDLTMFLAHMTPYYQKHLGRFPVQIVELLKSCCHSLPCGLRRQIVQALVLMCNRQMIGLSETLPLFMVLQTLGDKELKKLAFSHVVQSIRRMNVKHKNDIKNRSLQTVLFTLLQEEQELKARCALSILCDLHRRKVWYDERTANAICTACFHSSPKIMNSALAFLLGYDRNVENDSDEDEHPGSDEDTKNQRAHVTLSREAVYKANHKGTVSSKKKKKAKLDRVMRSLRKQKRSESENQDWNFYSPLQHLKDSQGFAEKLFTRLKTCTARFDVKVMIIKVIARAIGLHRLLLLNFYPYLQKYIQPHQQEVTQVLAAAIHACHDMVPPDAVESLLKQLVNQFVHDRARPEVIAVGLNAVREICLRMPLLMTEDLLRDLTLYKKSHEKAVSSAARSLIGLFRQICPRLLEKKDRGRGADATARPKAYGEKEVATDVPGAELLRSDSGNLIDNESTEEEMEDMSKLSDIDEAGANGESEGVDDAVANEEKDSESDIASDDEEMTDESEGFDDSADTDEEITDEIDDATVDASEYDPCLEENEASSSDDDGTHKKRKKPSMIFSVNKKRKLDSGNSEAVLSCQSLRALKKIVSSKPTDSDPCNGGQDYGILSNEDFKRIRQIQAKRAEKIALVEHGMLKTSSNSKAPSARIPSSEELVGRQVNPASLEASIHKRKTKEERLAIIKAGREERTKFTSRTATKQKKTGGLSNRQKEHKKGMPLAAKRAKIARSKREKQKGKASKRFTGRKAWK